MLTLNEDQQLLMDSARAAVAAHAPVSEARRLREPEGEGFSRAFWGSAPRWAGAACWFPRRKAARRSASSAPGWSRARWRARWRCRHFSRPPCSPRPRSPRAARRSSRRPGCRASRRRKPSSRFARRRAARRPLDGASRGRRLSARRREAFRARRPRRRRVHRRCNDRDAPTLLLVPADAPRRFAADPHPRRRASRRERHVRQRRRARGRAAAGRALALERTLDVGRAVLAASLCGVAEEAFRRTLDYLKERRQFDRRIGSFQALQHRAALAHIAVENAWSATLASVAGARRARARPPLSTSRSPNRRRAARPRT